MPIIWFTSNIGSEYSTIWIIQKNWIVFVFVWMIRYYSNYCRVRKGHSECRNKCWAFCKVGVGVISLIYFARLYAHWKASNFLYFIYTFDWKGTCSESFVFIEKQTWDSSIPRVIHNKSHISRSINEIPTELIKLREWWIWHDDLYYL